MSDDKGQESEPSGLISRVIEMIESGRYTEGILLTMAMLAVAEEVAGLRKGLAEIKLSGREFA